MPGLVRLKPKPTPPPLKIIRNPRPGAPRGPQGGSRDTILCHLQVSSLNLGPVGSGHGSPLGPWKAPRCLGVWSLFLRAPRGPKGLPCPGPTGPRAHRDPMSWGPGYWGARGHFSHELGWPPGLLRPSGDGGRGGRGQLVVLNNISNCTMPYEVASEWELDKFKMAAGPYKQLSVTATRKNWRLCYQKLLCSC